MSRRKNNTHASTAPTQFSRLTSFHTSLGYFYLCRVRQYDFSLPCLICLNLLVACATVDSPGKKLFTGGKQFLAWRFFFFASPLTLLEQTSGVARVILGFLLILSIFSWAIIFQKWQQFGSIDRKRSDSCRCFVPDAACPIQRTLRAGAGGTPLVAVYAAGYREFEAQTGNANTRSVAAASVSDRI